MIFNEFQWVLNEFFLSLVKEFQCDFVGAFAVQKKFKNSQTHF